MKIPMDKIRKHYWLCNDCAEKSGGIFPEGHVCTYMVDECLHCKKKDTPIIPWVDFNWPGIQTEHMRD